MAEPFNVEQFRQQMRGEAPPAPQPAPTQMQPAPAPAMRPPQQYSQAPQMPPQPMPQPMAPPQQMVRPMAAPMPQTPHIHMPAQPQRQQMAQPVPHPHAVQYQGYAQQMQPQTPMHHMPPATAFSPPPNQIAEVDEEASPKKSRFSLKRAKKEKMPKVKKAEKEKTTETHTAKKPPALIFMIGFACGVMSFLVANMVMSSVFSSNSSQNIAEVQQKYSSVQQPVLPQPKNDVEATEETTTP